MWLRWPAIIVLGFLALHSLSYGGGFISDSSTGAGEFGANDPSTEAAENLAGLVGVILVLLALTAIAGAFLMVRGHAGGAWVCAALGLSLMAIGVYWAVVGRVWDAGFYGAVGAVLAVLGVLVVRAYARPDAA